VRGGFLRVAERDAGIQRRGDERVPERVRPDGLGDPGAPGDSADDLPGAVPVQPTGVRGQEDGSFAALADRPGRTWREGDVTTLPPWPLALLP
jgi:hypothetical protein